PVAGPTAPHPRPAAPQLGNATPKGNWPPSRPAPRTARGKAHPSRGGGPQDFQQNLNIAFWGVVVPFRPCGEKVYQQRRESFGKDDPEGHCMPPGVPRTETTPYPFRIVQTPDRLFIIYEGGAHVWREVFLDGRPHDKDVEQSWLGDSVGHWEN